MVKVIHHPNSVTDITRHARVCCKRHSFCMQCGLAEFSIGLVTGLTLAFMFARVMF